MRIISKPLFRDFYDGVQIHGHDSALLFMRKTELFETNRESAPENLKFLQDYLKGKAPSGMRLPVKGGYTLYANYGVVLFAGKLYPYVEASIVYADLNKPDVVEHFYNKAAFYAFFLAHGKDLEKKEKERKYFYRDTEKNDENFFALDGSDALMSKALELGLSIVIYRNHAAQGMLSDNIKSYEVNGRLSAVDFARRVDAWQTYQELSMFLGNISSPAPATLSITDKDRHQQHGFDEWSFRKLPELKIKGRA